MIASTFERYQTIDQNNNLVSIQRVLYYRPFAPLVRGTEHAEGFSYFFLKFSLRSLRLCGE
jgi:hypothetical protein